MLTQAQKAERRTGIGGSDLAAICGKSPFKTALEVYMDKVSEDATEDKMTLRQRMGHYKEQIIADLYHEQTGYPVLHPENMYRHPEYNWMIGNIDRFAVLPSGQKIIVELKSTNERMSYLWGEVHTDAIPDAYLLQVAHYSIVTNIPRVDIAVLIGDADFRVYTYERDPELEEKIILIEKNYWINNILARIPPEPTTSQDISRLYPQHSPEKKILVNEPILKEWEELNLAKKNIKLYEEAKKIHELNIKSYLKDNEILLNEYGDKMATWKTQANTRLDVERLKKEMPEIYKKYSSTSSSRVLRLFSDQ